MINKLHPYQEIAVDKIEEKFNQYVEKILKQEILINTPFICFLKSITGSGKTAMLTATANKLLKRNKNSIVLWLSYSKVVVEQTLNNLSSGGRYNFLIPQVEIYSLQKLRSTLLTTAGHIIYLATTGTFNVNVKNKEDHRLIYDKGEDEGGFSGWELLKQRTFEKEQRELFIIYDEGHHFTAQQVDMLLELEPTGIILASGTPTYAGRLGELIEKANWKIENLAVAVPTSKVVESGLIKNKLKTFGYEGIQMGEIINSLIADLNKLNKLAKQKNLPKLKAIYVCKTNLLETETRQRDNLDLPFEERKAPPILIWWHLVEKCKIDPRKIAVCAKVDFKKKPDKKYHFNLFDGNAKENNYQNFLKGEYEHIIFNKGLIEGWDDPLVYCAYIDRNIGGDIQAEQLIGRVLRMPQACHYESDFEDLNTAFFYVKANSNEEFEEIVKKINKELENTVPGIKNEVVLASEKHKLTLCPARKTKYFPKIGTINENQAKLNIQYILENKVKDYSRTSPSFTEPYGGRTIIDIEIGKFSPKVIKKWEKLASYNKVSVKSVLRRNIIQINPRALDLTDFNRKEYREKLKFPIGINSQADKELKIIAQEIVNNFMETIKLITTYDNCRPVPAIGINEKKGVCEFENSVHQRYSGLNPLEEEAAKVIDGLGYDWTRNPVFSGYGIPLLSKGSTKMFYPDFLVWLNDDLVVAIETTGKSLLQDKIDRKLFKIESFDRKKAEEKTKIIPPSKVVVGVISTTNQKDKYQVYQVNKDNQPVPVSETMDMEGCVKLILETT
ncbi:MAG: DEAD/DEAH box helicase family protein [Candidatus Moeniiplasma glomeromycotorum]|nr:DEAD/DEAH box helicase family protein [Candidatus Moeniiplasma glomeromycotorum]MCE8168088.1 DEAD/DEAH box helicase family protein [Candidatus Moeniiplasma glomeromycotorum]MCE8169632.1 DEAD/DEAH box helicase family protein [Candidatus Moeniiplasma glomeromycotorum]